MSSVNHALQQYIENLELTKAERQEVIDQHSQVSQAIMGKVKVQSFFLTGSYKRHTAIRPLKDVDMFFVFDQQYLVGQELNTPTVLLERIKTVLRNKYPNNPPEITVQQRSVNIWFKGTSVGYDVVPGIARVGGGYQIPDRKGGSWRDTDPEIHAEKSTEANERANKKLKPLIKVVKKWNRDQPGGKVASSFLLEALSYDVFSTDPGDYADALAKLLQKLSEKIRFPCPDPAGLGLPVDSEWSASERERAQQALAEAANTARRAVDFQKRSDFEKAHYLWKKLLGDDYPEVGVDPGPEYSAPGNKAPDSPSGRFG